MFLLQLSNLMEFLSQRSRSLEEVLAFVVNTTLQPLKSTSAFISQVNSENFVENVCRYGISDALHDKYPPIYNLADNFPITDSIRNRKVVWINTLPNWPDDYPALKSLAYDSGDKTFICFPIHKFGSPGAVLGIFCEPIIHPDAETDAFLRAVGNLISLFMYPSSAAENSNRRVKSSLNIKDSCQLIEALSERQKIILRMMSQGDTNQLISLRLGYSDSTIRQETIKIFAMLGCNGRKEASQIYCEAIAAEPAQ